MSDLVRIVISDVHLGSFSSKEKKLFDFLKSTYFDELIINGDFLDIIKCPNFTEDTLDILNFLIESKKKVVYIIGNHDRPIINFSGKSFLNIEFCTSYSFDYSGRRYFVTHGDNYDSGLVKYDVIMKVISVVQNFFEKYFKIDIGTIWANFVNKKNKIKEFWSIVDSNISHDVVIIGHVHRPEVLIWVDKDSMVKTYANTGDWVVNNTYIEIKDGMLRLKKYD